MQDRYDPFSNETADWFERQSEIELDLGVLVSAASEWTEDETELDDLVSGLVDCGRVQLARIPDAQMTPPTPTALYVPAFAVPLA